MGEHQNELPLFHTATTLLKFSTTGVQSVNPLGATLRNSVSSPLLCLQHRNPSPPQGLCTSCSLCLERSHPYCLLVHTCFSALADRYSLTTLPSV